MTIDRKDTVRSVLVLCGAIPFFFFLSTGWARAALLGYLLTGLLFGVVLVGDYPPFGTSWFWKAMIPIVLVHSAIVFGLVWLDLNLPEINRMPRWLYGFAVLILVLEVQLSGRIIDAFQPPQQ
jgi:hypothetical protein